jgi:hypothetical protein
MMPILRPLLVFLSLFLWSSVGRAGGLVQLSIEGKLTPQAGAVVEVIWETDGTAQKASEDILTGGTETRLFLHLAQDTTAHDLARLLSAELKMRGAQGVFPGENTSHQGAAQIFVRGTTRLRLRLAPGLSATVTTCDSAPSKVQLLPPHAFPAPGTLVARTTTMHPHTRRVVSVLLTESFKGAQSAQSICEGIFIKALELELEVDRPTPDSWRPLRGVGGAAVIGCSIQLKSPGSDWGLDLMLASTGS